MKDISAHLKTVALSAAVAIAVCAAGWLILPGLRSYFAGFILGTVVSVINFHYLAMKVRQISSAVVERTGRRVNLGFLTRASMAVLAVMVTLKFEEFHIISTLAGIFFAQMITILLGVISYFHTK